MASETNYVGRRLALLILIAGAGVAVWRFTGGKLPALPRAAQTVTPPAPVAAPLAPQRVGDLPEGEISLLTSPSKAPALQRAVELFQSVYPGSRVDVRTLESRDGLQAILNGAERPDLYSPSEAGMVTSLNAAWKARQGRALVNTASTADDASVAETPLVFLTTAAKADALRPLLSADAPWDAIRKAVASRQGMRCSFANPLTSGSGLAALGMIGADAARAHRPLDGFLRELLPGLVYDDAARSGSSQLLEAYVGELVSQSGVSERDFIVTYENSALKAVAQHPELNLTVVYPRSVPVTLHRVCVLSRPDNAGPKRALAEGFVRFLKTPAAQALFQDEGLHPRFAADRRILPSANGFRQVQPAERAPAADYNRLMDAAGVWNRKIIPELGG